MSMVKKVARALAARIDPDAWETWIPFARDAIEAMRDPTEAMTKAQATTTLGGTDSLDGYLDYFCAEDVWKGMIDAALKDGG